LPFLVANYPYHKTTGVDVGISGDSVHKARQRLRERFKISDSATLEELIFGI
jgi:hypothetical protein